MAQTEFTLHDYYSRTIPLEDGMDSDLEASLPIRIRRFSIGQLQAFRRGFNQVINPPSERVIVRKPDGDEQERVGDGPKARYRIADDEILRRRTAEMTPELFAAFERMQREEDEFLVTFATEAITEHVWVPKGVTLRLVNDADDDEVIQGGPRSGAALVRAFAGNFAMLVRIVRAIHDENTLGPEAKKILRSLSVSTPSSRAPKGPGETPAAIAVSAGPSGSASAGDATASIEEHRSMLIAT